MNKKGFTLMELLAVILIVGVLSGVALPQYRKVVERSHFTKAQVMAKAMYDSAQRLAAEWGVDSYADLPASVKTISRLDIGGEDLLPVGFSIDGNTIKGAGFQYEMASSGWVAILRTSGTYQNTKILYSGTGFVCQGEDAACDVYGVDK